MQLLLIMIRVLHDHSRERALVIGYTVIIGKSRYKINVVIIGTDADILHSDNRKHGV